MTDTALRTRLQEALAEMERGPGAPCGQAQADGFPCPELGFDCTDCEYGRDVLLAWIAESEQAPAEEDTTPGGDW